MVQLDWLLPVRVVCSRDGDSMNIWDFIDAHPVLSVFMLWLISWGLAECIDAWRRK